MRRLRRILHWAKYRGLHVFQLYIGCTDYANKWGILITVFGVGIGVHVTRRHWFQIEIFINDSPLHSFYWEKSLFERTKPGRGPR